MSIAVQEYDTIVIGGGQAGLAIGYELSRQGRPFAILDAAQRIGDSWRHRWDSLHLFSPARYSGLPGMAFPAPRDSFPTKDAVAAYLAAYCARFNLPVKLNTRVDALTYPNGAHLVGAGPQRFSSVRVVVATGPFQRSRVPAFAAALAPTLRQLHADAYRNPGQIPGGDVLVVGAGNSGAEIAIELGMSDHRVWLAGRDTGYGYGFHWFNWWFYRTLVTSDSWIGRRVQMRAHRRGQGVPLRRIKPADIAQAGIVRVPRMIGVVDGKPQLADGRILDVATVVWATGFQPDYRWIALPIFAESGYPIHHRGVVPEQPGLYFLGLPFQHTPASSLLGGVGADARYIADHIKRHAATKRTVTLQPAPIGIETWDAV
jgi:putative flavoprotein involved in K+ transport